ncbi:transposase [Mycoplasmopsis felis]|uniref:transposase n=1 Tax=Mycoplasmopsis felis TaxID=33923 RepID=UPI0021AE49D1|nr:transposase [Mycoplasmopsis felis]UWV79186.1 transposase [Mycoplasmopsis felis]
MEKRCRKTKNEEKDAVIKYYQRIFYENDIEVDIKKIKELNKLSSKKKSKILCISRSTYYEKLKKEKVIVNKVIKHKKVICKSFYDNKGRYGRRKLAYYINKEYNITINPRTFGNYMKQLNLFTFVRKKEKKRRKNTNINFQDLVKRNYNSVNETIFATDVTYIPREKILIKIIYIYLK